MGESIKNACDRLRRRILEDGKEVRSLMQHVELSTPHLSAVADAGEVKANIMLAYRHLEDARMRLGKAIQAYDGGTSVYDK